MNIGGIEVVRLKNKILLEVFRADDSKCKETEGKVDLFAFFSITYVFT